ARVERSGRGLWTRLCALRERFGHMETRLVSLADRVPGGLSSVYMYFDPDDAARSLGTFSILREIEFCRREGLRYYYLGYFVAGSRTMAYKARFRPHEMLLGDDRWLTFRDRGEA
ncbi:MAG: arginyl-tRNA--protein transferase, partial [Phycisphaerales bacterium]|nr:arginyl-tRNA--protein transferase [Phycisphaerales bacterium]